MNAAPGAFAIGPKFALATPHRAATAAGQEIFESRGNALDAALAAAAVLAVVYPHQCSIGGDLFALVATPAGEVISINASGAAAAAADAEELRRSHTAMPLTGPLTITVPGVVAGWESIASLGATLPWETILNRAQQYAATGAGVAPSLARALKAERHLASEEGMRSVFFPNGNGRREGDIFRQPALAESLARIATEGASALYGGSIGKALVEGLRDRGGLLTLDDLLAHQTEVTRPIMGTYGEWEVLTTPPNSQGFLLLQILSMVERLGLNPDPLGPHTHMLADVYRIVSRERERWLADPAASPMPIEQLLGPEHIQKLSDQVSGPAPLEPDQFRPPPTGDTVALVAADSDGWCISLIQSVFHTFGSGLLEPKTGILCHNRGASFSLDAKSPNVLKAGKRPAHTLMPVIVRQNNRPVVIAGTMGARAQPQIHAQVLPRILQGDNVHAALSAPRMIVGGLDEGSDPNTILVEGRDVEVIERLKKRDKKIHRLGDWDEGAGHFAAIRVFGGERFEASSDPRADGSATAGPA